MLEFFANVSLSEIRLVRFIESRLHCGLMQRQLGSDEMLWSRGIFSLLDLDPEKEKPSLALLYSMQHPEDRLTMVQADANVLAGKPISRRYRVIRRDGTMRIISQHIEILFDSSGKPDRSLGLLVDVTDDAAREERQSIFDRRFEALTRESGLILNVLRPDGFVTQIVGGAPVHETELNRRYGFLWLELIHPDDREQTLAAFEQAVSKRTAVVREHRIKQTDGEYRWRRSTWTPVLDAGNKLVEFVSISADIEREKVVPTYSDDCLITGAQVRAARALSRWSVLQLSEAADVSASTIRRVEDYDGFTAGIAEALKRLCAAFENQGVEFIFTLTGKPGVRLA